MGPVNTSAVARARPTRDLGGWRDRRARGRRTCDSGLKPRVVDRVYAKLLDNQLADPDAIEFGGNVIAGNLTCTGNTMVWDSNETTALYPRDYDPNEVKGRRSGQCVDETRLTQGGPYGAANTF